jgi:hypothetical protein
MNECILNSFYVYIIVMVLIYLIKPSFLYYNEGDKCLFKNFGCGKNKTIINIQILSIVLSIFTYFLTRFLISLN